jgi:CBS domain-containing protein
MRIKDRPEYKSKPAPFSLRSDDVVPTAVKIMSEKNIGSVVIVDDDMQVKGIVTERDLLRRLLNKSLDPKTTSLSSIMTSEVKTGRADDEVIDWLRQMSNERFRHLPVIDSDGRLVNVMSQGDFVSFTWPDLLVLLKEKTRDTLNDTFKGRTSQLPILVSGMIAYAALVLVLVKLL